MHSPRHLKSQNENTTCPEELCAGVNKIDSQINIPDHTIARTVINRKWKHFSYFRAPPKPHRARSAKSASLGRRRRHRASANSTRPWTARVTRKARAKTPSILACQTICRWRETCRKLLLGEFFKCNRSEAEIEQLVAFLHSLCHLTLCLYLRFDYSLVMNCVLLCEALI
jgi:hypothetical protein